MSPRRMDISSLLREPSPPPLPASLQNILNGPSHHRQQPPPFLGLDALVHVASEERRRIIAVSPSSLPDRDHDRPYNYPLPSPTQSRQPDLYPFLQDNARPHKRPRDTCPPSPPRPPSPQYTFPLVQGQSTSPSTRRHPSASPTNNYLTLRQHPILHMEPTRSALSGPINDIRAIPQPPPLSPQHTSPFLHSLQQPAHSSPRNNSPHRPSPQHIRSQHHSPIHTGAPIPTFADPDVMSPRYGSGPKMAGGIEILSNDSPSLREPQRHDFSIYQSPMSMERLVSESHLDRAGHDPQKHSPLSGHAFPMDDDRHQSKIFSHAVEGQESVFTRERVGSRPHFSLPDVTTDNTKSMVMPIKEPTRHLPGRHPIRVWEEQPTPREPSRRISPARTPATVPALVEGCTWLATGKSGHRERPAKEDCVTASQQKDGLLFHSIPACCLTLVLSVPAPPLFVCKELSPPRHLTSGPLAGLQTTTRINPLPLSPIPVESEPPARFPQTFSTPPPSASPVSDLHLRNLGARSDRPERSWTQADAITSVPLTPFDPIVTELVPDKADLMPGDADTSPIVHPLTRQPSPEPVQPTLVPVPGMSMHPTHAEVPQSTSRRSPQQPLPEKDEHNAPLEALISPPIQPEPVSYASPEPEHTTKPEPGVPEQTMMDVDEELLSLVEDRPARAIPAFTKVQIDAKLPPLITVRQATGAGTEQDPSEASDGPSSLPSSQPVLKAPLMADEEKDRASMPPPAARNKKTEKDKSITATAATGSKKKKDGTSKVCIPH